MGNWHCVPSSCARVVYREYLPSMVRWRYPGEPWQEIEGDNYSTKIVEDLSGSKSYCLLVRHLTSTNPDSWGNESKVCGWYFNGIQSWRLVPRHIRVFYYPPDNKHYDFSYDSSTGFYGSDYFFEVVSQGQTILNFISRGDTSMWITGITANTPAQKTTACIFTVTKNGQTVHTETRAVCPEVEKLPCRLSNEFKERKIDKFAFTERIEVRNQSINSVFVGPTNLPFIDTKSLPVECLNIYNTYTLAPPELSEYVPLPGVINPYNFIQQICSAPGCPPPEYTVICDCDCEECPSGTCAVNCDGHICCYDTETGISVKSIAVENYCGGTP